MSFEDSDILMNKRERERERERERDNGFVTKIFHYPDAQIHLLLTH